MANLVELYDLVIQAQALNGVPLSHGHVYVYALGRTKLMDTWSDIDGESLNPNPVILDNAGQAHIYVSDDFDYTLVFTDEYDNEIFSVDKYLLSKGEHSHADVAVAPSEHIGVSSYHVGEVTVYVPYLTGEVGKVYEGIDPIVVNNDVNRISANHIPLGVQDPLYFVEDSETACIIGCSAQTEIPAELSGKWDNAADAVIANSAQWAEGTEYEAGNYISIDNNTLSVTGLTPVPADTASTGLVASVSADITAMIPDTSDMATQTWVNEQGFLTAIPSEYVTENTLQSGLSSKLDSTAFSTVSGNFLTAHQSLDGLMSADLLEISDNKITGYNGTAFAGQGGVTGDYELVAGSGVELVDDPDAHTTTINVTAQGGNPEVEQAVIDNSANWNEVSAKADTSATIPIVSSIYPFVTATDYIGAVADISGNFYQIVSRTGDPESAWVVEYRKDAITRQIYWENNATTWPISSNMVISPYYLQFADAFNVSPGWFNASGVITANTIGFTANGISAYSDSAWGGFSANGITAGPKGPFAIQGQGESLTESYGNGFLFSSVNTGIGSARLTIAYPNTFVHIYSPKFEAKNISGAGFSIEASGARGYDENGNVIWDTHKPPKLIGWANYQGTAIDPRASGINGGIIATVYPDNIPQSMQLSSAPYTYMNGNGFYEQVPGTLSSTVDTNGFSFQHSQSKVTAAMSVGDVYYRKYNNETSATDNWSLTASVQKREIECDTATSAITAIAGSAIGGGGGGVPQSAFDELKQSYDALSALFAQYSGQWLLPNEGEE